MKILLIGGTGILSSEICKRSIEKGYDVTILNRGKRMTFFDKKAKLIIADVRNDNMEKFKSILNQTTFDVVVDFLSYNVEQLQKTCEIISGICKQLIFISSATVYEDNVKALPYTEKCFIDHHKWDYSTKKAQCEKFLKENADKFNLKYTIVRPYVTYGKTRIPYQFAPIEYYTIVNRLKLGKPIPIYGDNIKCTLTNSRDFAIGAVGLFDNPKAFGLAVHITANQSLTWKYAIEIVGNKLGKQVQLVQIPKELLASGVHECGIETNEIFSDKGRDMVFDNSLIKKLVPEYRETIPFETGIDESLQYYKENIQLQKVNYAWDARIDNLIERSIKLSGGKICYRTISVQSYNKTASNRDKLIYIANRYNSLRKLLAAVKHLKR